MTTTTPQEQPEGGADRRHREIREAAIGIFLASGYEGATMEGIAVRAGVSKQTVYKHFTDKQHLFADIVLSTTDDMDALVGLIAEELTETSDLAGGLEHLAETFLVALMQPRVLRLRRLVISSADRFPEIATAWYERGFERVLEALSTSFRALADRQLLAVDDAAAAADHFVGMLFWIPVNKAMFTGDDDYSATHDLAPVARSAVQAFMNAYGCRPLEKLGRR
ncbi:MAG: TetR/AcrR family transcriptional regulator [Acidimicrobiales bacterium]|jgi:TetR/AcrR family transcriptional repressor of mexJK operon